MQPFFVFEMANNHMGDVEHGLQIIREMAKISKDFRDFHFGIKLQFRNLPTYIHPDYAHRTDIKYVKRFLDTELSKDELKQLVDEIKVQKLWAICTPFDEQSVDLIEELDIEFIKIASASLTDWPLLERIVKSNRLIIASTGGSSFDEIDKVVTFFEHRKKTFFLLHCVGEYPVKSTNLNLRRIAELKSRYPNIRIGFSTHEEPDNYDAIKIAIGCGATAFEKHVGIETNKYKLNPYSANPSQVRKWLETAKSTFEMFGEVDQEFSPTELHSLQTLRRGVFANRTILEGERITLSDIFLAFPPQDGQLVANNLSKYTEFWASRNIAINASVMISDVYQSDNREEVKRIVKSVKEAIQKSGIVIPSKVDLEISHHYGIENFNRFGLVMMIIVNREYCKKIIIMFPGQEHPEQYHVQKEETFYIISGSMTMTLDKEERACIPGDVVTIERGVKHSFKTTGGVILEEISSTHYKYDSFYTDPAIMSNTNRKTLLTDWIKDESI